MASEEDLDSTGGPQPAPDAAPLAPAQGAGLAGVLDPLMSQLDSIGRTVRENTLAIMRIDETIAAQANIAGLPRLITTLHEDLQNRNGVNEKLFDAMHDELRGYKDGFLLDVLHLPLIRDLVVLYDDLSEIHRRSAAFLATFAPGFESAEVDAARDHLTRLSANLDNIVDSLLEVLARMDVHRLDPTGGKLDKTSQRVVSVEPAASPEEDLSVTASLKPGFRWRDRTVRPEEVTVKRWRQEGAPE